MTPPFDTLKVEHEIFISPTADALLLRCREHFASSVALPIAWLHLDADVESSRRRKHERVREGAAAWLFRGSRCVSASKSMIFMDFHPFRSYFAGVEGSEATWSSSCRGAEFVCELQQRWRCKLLDRPAFPG